jgi:outer membrane protein
MKKILYTVAICLSTIVVSSQNIGHINTQELLQQLPDYNQAKVELENFAAEQQKEFEQFAKLYKDKEDKYVAKENACKKDPENCDRDLLQMEYNNLMESAEKLEKLQYEMEAKIQEREGFLINKIVKKIKMAAEEVAKEKGLLYVLDQSSILYAGGEDISVAVKAKLAK